MFAHRNVSWTVEQSGCIFSVTIAGFPVLDSVIGNGFLYPPQRTKLGGYIGFTLSVRLSVCLSVR